MPSERDIDELLSRGELQVQVGEAKINVEIADNYQTQFGPDEQRDNARHMLEALENLEGSKTLTDRIASSGRSEVRLIYTNCPFTRTADRNEFETYASGTSYDGGVIFINVADTKAMIYREKRGLEDTKYWVNPSLEHVSVHEFVHAFTPTGEEMLFDKNPEHNQVSNKCITEIGAGPERASYEEAEWAYNKYITFAESKYVSSKSAVTDRDRPSLSESVERAFEQNKEAAQRTTRAASEAVEKAQKKDKGQDRE